MRWRNDASDVDNPGDVRDVERMFVIRIGRWERRDVTIRSRNWIDPSVNFSVDMVQNEFVRVEGFCLVF